MVNLIPYQVNTFRYGLLGRGSGIDSQFASFCCFFLLGGAGGHSIAWHLQFSAVIPVGFQVATLLAAFMPFRA